jgi:uncharacterized protein YciI
MNKMTLIVLLACLASGELVSADSPSTSANLTPDKALAKQLGADENGMRHDVLVILKTGKHRVPDGPPRDEMFKGHFANINRLANEGKLAVAGPFTDKTDWRGLFILAVDNVSAAQLLVATDPVIKNGEMVAEYHLLYSSAALMSINNIHQKMVEK